METKNNKLLMFVDKDGVFTVITPPLIPTRESKRAESKDVISNVEQIDKRYRKKSTSDAEMEAFVRWLIYKHYSDNKRSIAKKIREASVSVIAASCRRRTRLYSSVRAGLEIQYSSPKIVGLNYKRGFLLEIRREVAAQIDSVNSPEEMAYLPKAVQKVIAREARRCLREYTNEKRLNLPDSNMNAIETVIADAKDEVQAFVNREGELAELKALLDTGKLKGQQRELALILRKHPDLVNRGSVKIARMLGWNPAHVRQVKRRLTIAANKFAANG